MRGSQIENSRMHPVCALLKPGIYSAAGPKTPGREQNAQQIGVNRLAASILNAPRFIVWRQTPARYNWPLIRARQKVNSPLVPAAYNSSSFVRRLVRPFLHPLSVPSSSRIHGPSSSLHSHPAPSRSTAFHLRVCAMA